MRNPLLLLLAAVIWGVAFVAQSVGMDYVGPFTFNAVRSLIGSAFLVPCIWFLGKVNPPTKEEKEKYQRNQKQLWIGGLCCGVALTVASMLQQIGIMYTSVGKAGFITAFYIIIVPIMGLALGKRCGLFMWIGVLLALAGLYFLCITEKLTIGKGDILVFACAICFSVHILVIDHFSPMVDGVKLSCIQFLVCGVLCSIVMFAKEQPQILQILAAAKPILYAGIMSCGVAYTLQIVGQKGMNPTIASLLLSMESVVSVLAGLLILHQRLSVRETCGCILMFAAIVFAQLPQKDKS